MCQAQSEGGRRCPAHQPYMVALFQHLEDSDILLNPAAVQEIFTDLRKEYHDAPDLRADRYSRFIRRLSISDPGAELEYDDNPGADALQGSTVEAAKWLTERVYAAEERVDKFLSAYSINTGHPVETAYKLWETLSTNFQQRPSAVTEEQIAAVRANGLPTDPLTVHVWHRMRALGDMQEQEPRVTQFETFYSSTGEAFRIGYDSGRLEVKEPYTSSHQVTEAVYETLTKASDPLRFYRQNILGNSIYQYATAEEADADRWRRRCASCGQFAVMSAHTCPAKNHVDGGFLRQNKDVAYPEHDPAVPRVLANGREYTVQEQQNPQDHGAGQPLPWLATRDEGDHVVLEHPYDMWVVSSNNLHEVLNEAVLTPEQMNQIRDAMDDRPMLNGEPVPVIFFFHETLEETDNDTRTVTTLLHAIPESELDPLLGEDGQPKPYREGFIRRPRQLPMLHQDAGQPGVRERLFWYKEATTGGVIKIEPRATPVKDVDVSEFGKLVTFTAGRVPATRRALGEGKVALIPLNVTYPRADVPPEGGRWDLDDQGFPVESLFYPSKVEGDIALREGADGMLEVLTSSRTLRCNCAMYKRHYHCTHVDHALRHAGRAVRVSLDEQAASASDGLAETLETLTGAAPAFDAETMESLGDLGYTRFEMQDGRLTLDLASFAPNLLRRPLTVAIGRGQLAAPAVAAERPDPAAGLEPFVAWAGETQYQWDEQVAEVQNIHQLPEVETIRKALAHADVTVPIRSGTVAYPHVEGTVVFAQTSSAKWMDVTVRSHTLKCACADYRQDYDCVHVRTVAAHARTALFTRRDRAFLALHENEDARILDAHTYQEALSVEQQFRYKAAVEAYQVVRRHNGHEDAVAAVPELISAQDSAWERERVRRMSTEEYAVWLAEDQRKREERYRAAEASYQGYRDSRAEAWNQVDPAYVDNPEQFFNDFDNAERWKRGKRKLWEEQGRTPLPFIPEGDVTDGVCAPGGRGFGIELEFQLPANESPGARNERLEAIGRDLYAAGLVSGPEQQDYHTASENGYLSSNWSFEADDTVAGEMVSPILHDTPEAWEQVKKVCDIITANGGSARSMSGSHVNISTGSYGGSAAKHAELTRVVVENTSPLFRLASNPKAGRHRGDNWCKPLLEPPLHSDIPAEHTLAISQVFGMDNYEMPDHGDIINLANSADMGDPSKSRVEFRLWDGTLDPAVIQQQVAVSAALIDLAERTVETSKQSAGSRSFWYPIPAGDLTPENTPAHAPDPSKPLEAQPEFQKVASLFDKLFRRKEDRARALTLFAINRWTETPE